MKKNYIIPQIAVVRIASVGSVLTSASVENLGGQASKSTVGFSRDGGSSWDDED